MKIKMTSVYVDDQGKALRGDLLLSERDLTAPDDGDLDLGDVPAQDFKIRREHRLVADVVGLGADIAQDDEGRL